MHIIVIIVMRVITIVMIISSIVCVLFFSFVYDNGHCCILARGLGNFR